MEPKDKLDPHFTFLYEQLKDIFNSYAQYIFSTTSAILLITGWLLTSKDTRAYIASQPWLKVPMIVAVALFIGAEVWFSRGALNQSQHVVGLIEKAVKQSNDDRLLAYYQPRIVSGTGVFIAAHSVLYAVLIAIICSIKPSETAQPNNAMPLTAPQVTPAASNSKSPPQQPSRPAPR